MERCYSELIALPSLQERYDYCKLGQGVSDETFGYERYLNQVFYKSYEWREVKRKVILRDNGCEFGLKDYPIMGRIIVHHLIPLTVDDILNHTRHLIDPEYLISVSHLTHNAIHYGSADILPQDYKPRTPNDTCLWKKGSNDEKQQAEIQSYVCRDSRTGRKVVISI